MAYNYRAKGVREIMLQVKTFFEREKREGTILQDNIMSRLSVATGIPHRSLYRIIADPVPGCKKRKKSHSVELDDFDQQAIIRKIHDFYRRKEFPTLDKLLVVLRKDIGFTGSRTTLWRIVKQLGFKYKKQCGRKFLIEKPEIVMLRHQYLRKMKKLRESKPPSKIIYMDETWLNANHTVGKCWMDADGNGGIPSPLGKGQRLIIVHAGSSLGFVPNAKLSFVSKKSSDYHDEMNSQHFEEWLVTKVFPNIPEGSTIVMDNASYHSVRAEKVPTSNTKKADKQDWLRQNNITFSEKMKKTELYELIKMCKPRTLKYKIDELAKEHGHDVIRLPPYHCDLNAIELIWSQVKGYVARHNKTFTIKDTQKLLDEALATVSAEDWNNAIKLLMAAVTKTRNKR